MTTIETAWSIAHSSDTVSIPAVPDVPVGDVQLIGWYDDELTEPIYLPVDLAVGDWVVAVVTPLDVPNSTVHTDRFTVRVGGYQLPTSEILSYPNVYRIDGITGQPGFTPDSRCRMFFAVYRGLGENDSYWSGFQSLNWNSSRTTLSATQPAMPYAAYYAQVVNVLYANAVPALNEVNYSRSLPYRFTDIIPAAGNPAIDPDREVRLEFFSGPQPSPVPSTTITSNGYWDDEYDLGWGSINFHTFILGTQQVPLVPEDPDNPAPAGNSHLPIS